MNLEIIKIASFNKNNRKLVNSTHSSKNKNPICGDEIELNIRMNNGKIVDFGYIGKSCVYCHASASIISRILKNENQKNVKKILSLGENFYNGKEVFLPKKWIKLKILFNKRNFNRKECIYLPFKTLTSALKL